VVEWGRLLSGYRGEILGRRFESCPPRHRKRVRSDVFFFTHEGHKGISKKGKVRGYFKLSFIPRCEPLNPSLS
jgi:hypothetical protein